jgi:putative ABC transport system permease protein
MAKLPLTRARQLRSSDLLQFNLHTLLNQRFRGIMILCAMGLGVAAVLVLTALGEGARGYIINEFSSIGKDVLIILPGRNETTGGMPPLMGTAARDITLEEAAMLPQRISAITHSVPVIIGSITVAHQQRSREVITVGTTEHFLEVNHLTLAQGKNLSAGDFRSASGEVLIGENLKRALFDNQTALGAYVRIGDSRFRVVGVLNESVGAMGIDFGDAVIIPVASAQRLFNVSGLFRVLVFLREGYPLNDAKKRIENTMQDFHQGELDITVISPDSMRATFDGILATMTMAVAAIGAISLLVAGVLIMNVMLISVSQRTREIGLLKALGASAGDIMRIFLGEAMLMTGAGAFAGVIFGLILVNIACLIFPDIPFRTPAWAYITAIIVALVTGMLFSWLPARRASQLQPVMALQKP